MIYIQQWTRLSCILLIIETNLFCSRCIADNLFLGLTSSASGVTFSEANGVSADGSAVVGTLVTGAAMSAFHWTISDGLHVLAGTRQGQGISGDGFVVVGDAINPDTEFAEPFRWSGDSGLQLLGGPDAIPLDSSTSAVGTSYDGAVIVGQTRVPPEWGSFRWTAETGVMLLDSDREPTQSDYAAAISSDGQTIVGAVHSLSTDLTAYQWTAANGMTLLGNLLGQDGSEAVGVSADGAVVVGQSGVQAFRWTEGMGMVALATSNGLSPYGITPAVSLAYSTTQTGEAIVGASSATISNGGSFIWTEKYGMESLAQVLIHRYDLGAELSGWQLTEARSISADGRTIVGAGIDPEGRSAAWLVRLDQPIFVPEPASALLAAIGLLAMLRSQSPKQPDRAFESAAL